METIEQLKDLINKSELGQLQKNVMNGFTDRAKEENEKKHQDRQLIQEVANEKKLSEVILSTEEVKIYTVSGKDEWDFKYPFRSIYLDKKGTWKRSTTVSPSLDIAYLVHIENKYLGQNSRFIDFALKMLEIKIED